MIFDKLASIAESHLPKKLRGIVSQAALFAFRDPAHTFLPNEHDDTEREWFQENFFLPFRVVAVEDPASCIVLMDKEADSRGLAVDRFFLECLPVNYDMRNFRPDDNLGNIPEDSIANKAINILGKDACAVSWGEVKYHAASGGKYTIEGFVEYSMIASSSDRFEGNLIEDRRFGQEAISSCFRNAGAAIQEIMYLKSPDRHIVKETPGKIKQNHLKSGRILRSQERPIYVFMHAHEIRKTFDLPGDRETPSPHKRRSHLRKLDGRLLYQEEGQDHSSQRVLGWPPGVYQGEQEIRSSD